MYNNPFSKQTVVVRPGTHLPKKTHTARPTAHLGGKSIRVGVSSNGPDTDTWCHVTNRGGVLSHPGILP